MGKASRRKRQNSAEPRDPASLPAPFARRPFEGLAGEPQLVAMREIVPAATAAVSYSRGELSGDATLATVLPMAWAGVHRDDDSVLIGMQSGTTSGDASRDLAEALLATVQLPGGTPLPTAPKATAGSPRLQEVLTNTSLELRLHDGFEFWVEGQELDAEAAASLERANEAVAPTVQLQAADCAFWCRIGEHCYVRWVLPHDEDRATDALARLHAAGRSRLGQGRLLGAFRSCGLLIPVWEVDRDRPADAHETAMGELAERLADALAQQAPLSVQERRARNGVVSRQVTLR